MKVACMLVLLLFASTEAKACFGGRSKEERNETMLHHKIIFYGRVVKVQENWWMSEEYYNSDKPTNIGILVTYKVLKAYRGVPFRRDFFVVRATDYREKGLFEIGEEGLVVTGHREKRHGVYMFASSTKAFQGICSCMPKWKEDVYQGAEALQKVEAHFRRQWIMSIIICLLGGVTVMVVWKKGRDWHAFCCCGFDNCRPTSTPCACTDVRAKPHGR